MKNQKLLRLFLILLPVLAVGLATTGNSVTVVDSATGNVAVGSYFALIPETGNLQILPPLAGILAVMAVILGIGYQVTGRRGLLTGILWVAILSASAASLPIALRGELVVVPHVLLPLLMCTQAGLAWWMEKNQQMQTADSGRKLKKK